MQKQPVSDEIESTTLGWKFVAIVGVITAIFFTFLYLAMSSEPDYMPNRPAKTSIQDTTPNQVVQPIQKDASQ
jgi:hypothetical protein